MTPIAQHYLLPISERVPSIQDALNGQNTLVVQAPPGAGKSTLLPLMLLNSPWLHGKKILILEPRRLAAKSIAQRMSAMVQSPIGETIGYRIRFETKISKNTKIEVITEGILTRILQNDNALEEVGLVIFDEFHERSIHADLALALTREIQSVLRPDLRILVMSATLEHEHISRLLQCKTIISKGKMFPVTLAYGQGIDLKLIPELVAGKVVEAIKTNQSGDVLVFLPGQGEIRKCEAILQAKLPSFSILPLYGQLSFAEQNKALRPDSNGKRKIVLATSIAETSLTIEGVTIVVDSGLGRYQKFDPNTGLARLVTTNISIDEADQRAGRAGRLAPGTCYRMWTKATHSRLSENRIPEIEHFDLASLMLELAKWGIQECTELSWITEPPKGHVQQANALLEDLSAIDGRSITQHGIAMQRLPCHPRLAHMLLMAEKEGALGLATDLAAVLEERDPLDNTIGADINLRIEALRRFRKNNGQKGPFGKISKSAGHFRSIFKNKEENQAFDPFESGILLAYAFPERIAHARPGNNAQFKLANGRLAQLNYRDDLAQEAWLAVAHLDAREGMGKIFLASSLNPKDLSPLVKEKETIEWDKNKGHLKCCTELRIGSIVLKSIPIKNYDKVAAVAIVSKVVASEGKHLLQFDRSFLSLQSRIESIKTWNPNIALPNVHTDHLLACNMDWLGPYFEQVRTEEDLAKINLYEAILPFIGYELVENIEQMAPEYFVVPTGSKVQIQYSVHGEAPVVSVRLQEMFGVTDTPYINGGKTPLTFHLLSPGFKPVQITTDLKSFWNSAYFEVRKELKRRYPKHEWPDDPLKAQPIRGVKKRR